MLATSWNEAQQFTCIDCKIQYVDPDDRKDDGADLDTMRFWICAEQSKKPTHNFPCLTHFGVSISYVGKDLNNDIHLGNEGEDKISLLM